jgi:hypothetical protein
MVRPAGVHGAAPQLDRMTACRDVCVQRWAKEAGKRFRIAEFVAKVQDPGRFGKPNVECHQVQSGHLHMDGTFVLHITQVCAAFELRETARLLGFQTLN